MFRVYAFRRYKDVGFEGLWVFGMGLKGLGFRVWCFASFSHYFYFNIGVMNKYSLCFQSKGLRLYSMPLQFRVD